MGTGGLLVVGQVGIWVWGQHPREPLCRHPGEPLCCCCSLSR